MLVAKITSSCNDLTRFRYTNTTKVHSESHQHGCLQQSFEFEMILEYTFSFPVAVGHVQVILNALYVRLSGEMFNRRNGDGQNANFVDQTDDVLLLSGHAYWHYVVI